MLSDRSVPTLGKACLRAFLKTSAAFGFVALFAFTLTTQGVGAPARPEIPPAFGPCLNLKPADFADAKSFRGTDRR